MKLNDSKLSGNAWKVRLLMRHLGIDFSRETLNLAEGKHTLPEFSALNPFHRIPVLELDNGDHLFESNAMLLHLAEGTDLLPTDPTARSHIIGWLFFEQADLLRFLAYPRYWRIIGAVEENADIIAHYHELARANLTRVEAALCDAYWVFGEDLTVVDFALYPYISLSPEGGLSLDEWPNIKSWIARFETLPNFEKLVA